MEFPVVRKYTRVWNCGLVYVYAAMGVAGIMSKVTPEAASICEMEKVSQVVVREFHLDARRDLLAAWKKTYWYRVPPASV
jgi:hypothetical protein